MQTLEQAIAAWDGKSVNDIQAIYAQNSGTGSFTASLLALLRQANLETGVSWLIKRHLETGAVFSKHQTSQIFKRINTFKYWQAKLPILQSLPYLTITKADKLNIENFLRNCLIDNNKFRG